MLPEDVAFSNVAFLLGFSLLYLPFLYFGFSLVWTTLSMPKITSEKFREKVFAMKQANPVVKVVVESFHNHDDRIVTHYYELRLQTQEGNNDDGTDAARRDVRARKLKSCRSVKRLLGMMDDVDDLTIFSEASSIGSSALTLAFCPHQGQFNEYFKQHCLQVMENYYHRDDRFSLKISIELHDGNADGTRLPGHVYLVETNPKQSYPWWFNWPIAIFSITTIVFSPLYFLLFRYSLPQHKVPIIKRIHWQGNASTLENHDLP